MAFANELGSDHGNDAYLSKIDSLRATNVGSMISLPQVVAVGDQSSGKSSALESLTGFAFPRATTLCTRFATEISCIRDERSQIVISIIPRPDADDDLKGRLQAFRRISNTMNDADLAQIFQDAIKAMGIRIEGELEGYNRSAAFSEDILKIEIRGPEQTHLTLIDVPGIFRIPTPGLTTENDINLVRNMVKRYMNDSRTIILAVIPCNIDIANQEILRLANEADPDGVRTMGVLTKPDLVTENATKSAVIELLDGQRNPLKLGYCVIKNRSADDHTSSTTERLAAERAFFQSPPWSSCAGVSIGTESLRTRLRNLVLNLSKREFPHVRAAIEARRRVCAAQLTALGPSRDNEMAQREYLVKIAAHAQAVTTNALNAYYAADGGLFERRQELRLITKIIQLGEQFSDEFWKMGHLQDFRHDWNDDDESFLRFKPTLTIPPPSPPLSKYKKRAVKIIGHDDSGSNNGIFPADPTIRDAYQAPPDTVADPRISEINHDGDARNVKNGILPPEVMDLDAFEELRDIVSSKYSCPDPRPGPLLPLVRDVYQSSRGPELGTFNGTVLATVFKKVSEKWEPLVLAYVSKAIVLVHKYVRTLLGELCADEGVREQLWDLLLRDALCERYQAAIDHARFLIKLERSEPPATLNHFFNSNVEKQRQNRMVKEIEAFAENNMVNLGAAEPIRSGGASDGYIAVSEIKNMVLGRDNHERICEDILDTVESYYKVARKRFVDAVCRHVVHHILLFEEDISPVRLLSPVRIMKLNDSQLAAIAGEDAVTRSQRQMLQRQLESLNEATKVLRS